MRELLKATRAPLVSILIACLGVTMFAAERALAAEPDARTAAGQAVAGQYIVVLRKDVVGVPVLAQSLVSASGRTVL